VIVTLSTLTYYFFYVLFIQMPLFLTFEKYFFFQQLETFDYVENFENNSFQFLFINQILTLEQLDISLVLLSVKISSTQIIKNRH